MRAFNSIYKTNENRGMIKMRFIALGLTFMIALVLIVAIILLVVGQILLDYAIDTVAFEWLSLNDYAYYLILLLRFMVIFVAFFIAISTIYYFGPAIHYNWKFFSFGSLFATLSSLLVSYGFSFYITNFGT